MRRRRSYAVLYAQVEALRRSAEIRGRKTACILGLDIGATSIVGILIRLPDQVVGVASCHLEIVASPVGRSKILGNGGPTLAKSAGGVGVTGMLPALVLLDDQGQLVRLSIQQSDGRRDAQVAALRSNIDEALFLAKAGNGINQQLVRGLVSNEPENSGASQPRLGPMTTSIGNLPSSRIGCLRPA
jgi:sugar (pentulose or hexulose) kinase